MRTDTHLTSQESVYSGDISDLAEPFHHTKRKKSITINFPLLHMQADLIALEVQRLIFYHLSVMKALKNFISPSADTSEINLWVPAVASSDYHNEVVHGMKAQLLQEASHNLESSSQQFCCDKAGYCCWFNSAPGTTLVYYCCYCCKRSRNPGETF